MKKIKESESSEEHLLLKAYNLEREFYRTRERLYFTSQQYFHQSIMGDYVKEKDIKNLMDECSKIKKEYREIRSILISYHDNDPIWTFKHFSFSKEL